MYLTAIFLAEKFRFSAEFIEMRRQALDIFINRVASHNGLRQSEDLRIFLQADEQVSKLDYLIRKFSFSCHDLNFSHCIQSCFV